MLLLLLLIGAVTAVHARGSPAAGEEFPSAAGESGRHLFPPENWSRLRRAQPRREFSIKQLLIIAAAVITREVERREEWLRIFRERGEEREKWGKNMGFPTGRELIYRFVYF